jgi:hypothetical protein
MPRAARKRRGDIERDGLYRGGLLGERIIEAAVFPCRTMGSASRQRRAPRQAADCIQRRGVLRKVGLACNASMREAAWIIKAASYRVYRFEAVNSPDRAAADGAPCPPLRWRGRAAA